MKIEEIIQTQFICSNHKAIVNLRYTSNYFSNIHNNFMLEFDVTMPQFNILRILRGAKKPLNINSVKEKMIDKSPNTTRIMDKLVVKKLINRFHCESDRRTVFIEINNGGLQLLSQIDEKMISTEFFTNNLSEEEADTLSSLLDKMRG